MLCRTYAAFLEHVSAGRNMDIAKVRRLARGRVWSGQDAFQHGLVDGLGGLLDAITTAKELANFPQVQSTCAFQHYHMKASSVRWQAVKVIVLLVALTCEGLLQSVISIHAHTLPCSMHMQM